MVNLQPHDRIVIVFQHEEWRELTTCRGWYRAALEDIVRQGVDTTVRKKCRIYKLPELSSLYRITCVVWEADQRESMLRGIREMKELAVLPCRR